MKSLIWDGLGLVGLVLLSIGLWWTSPALCMIVDGLILVTGAVAGAKLWQSSRRSGND